MMIFMLDIDSHLSFDLWMTLKRNVFNVISVHKLVENEVLHYILGLLCRKLQIQVGRHFEVGINKTKSRSSRSELEFDLSNFV